MKRVFVCIGLVLGFVGVVLAQEAFDIQGSWAMSIESPQGETPVTLKFNAPDGEKISGSLESPQGELALAGKLAGKEISFTGTFEGGGRSITLGFLGTVQADGGIVGIVDFGGMGTGKWSAKKSK